MASLAKIKSDLDAAKAEETTLRQAYEISQQKRRITRQAYQTEAQNRKIANDERIKIDLKLQ